MSNVGTPQALMKTIRGLHNNDWSARSTVLSVHASMDSTTWTLGLLDSLAHPALQSMLRKLGRNQDCPNPFFELPMLEPSAMHLGKGRIKYLYLSERIGAHESLKLFAPASFEKSPFLRRPYLRIWSSIFAPLSQPLVSNSDLETTVDALKACLLSPVGNAVPVMQFDDLPTETPFFEQLFSSQALQDRVHCFSHYERAAYKQVPGTNYEEQHVTGKRKQRLRVAMQRLEKLGTVQFACAKSGTQIMQALEQLLALEKNSWKGRRGTALLQKENLERLARENIANMVRDNRCEIHSLLVDKQSVASIVFYKSGGSYFPWKTAYDENFARYSVGNLLVNHTNQLLSQREDFRYLDSLAAEGNKTALRFWPDRQKLCSLAVGLGDDGSKTAKRVMDELVLLRRTKAYLKKVLFRKS